MYQLLLTRKYLTSKLMPLLAMLAVLLSVATVLVTWSVMGGFLRTLLDSGRGLVGDVIIRWPTVGFAHSDDLIGRLELHPDIQAATPTIECFAVIRLPTEQTRGVQVHGVDPGSFLDVTAFDDFLWWRPLDEPTPKDKDAEDFRVQEGNLEALGRFLENGRTMTRPDEDGVPRPAAVLGIEMTGLNSRTERGFYIPFYPSLRTIEGGGDPLLVFVPERGHVTLTLLPTSGDGRFTEPVTRRIAVANEFQSGVYEADTSTVLVPLDWLQRALHMDESSRVVEEADPFEVEVDPLSGDLRPVVRTSLERTPARVTDVLVRARPGADAEEVRRVCREIYREFAKDHAGEVPPADVMLFLTWADLKSTLVAAVKKETALVLFLFGIMCFTSVFLVLAIFWAMINEKTRDIGILRALGASTSGVAGIWLSYGAALGVVGSALGVGAATLIVRNINEIHTWLGESLGLVIWDPRVYYIFEIPSEILPQHAVFVFIAGVGTCVLGSAIPAIRSANMDPVKALRFE